MTVSTLGISRRQHHHVGIGEGPQLPTDLQAVDSRQCQIENDHIRIGLAGNRQSVHAVVRDADFEMLALKVAGYDLSQRYFIIDHQCAVGAAIGAWLNLHGFDVPFRNQARTEPTAP